MESSAKDLWVIYVIRITQTQFTHLMTGNCCMLTIVEIEYFIFFVLMTEFLGWNKDFKPAPYPETEEERRAAAKKYGLLPEEYKPYPPDCMLCRIIYFFTLIQLITQKFFLVQYSAIRWLSAFRRQTSWTKRCLLSIWSSWIPAKFSRTRMWHRMIEIERNISTI